MDILAHALWAAVGTTVAARRFRVGRRTAAATVALAVLPDVLHALPIAAWVVFGEGTAAALVDYAVATMGTEPALPATVAAVTDHIHCVTHSAVVASALTLLTWMATRTLWIPLLGWWCHIVIDVFTHSSQFYPSPVLYPFTMRGFDGLAWNTPWFIAVNYASLAVVWVCLLRTRNRP